MQLQHIIRRCVDSTAKANRSIPAASYKGKYCMKTIPFFIQRAFAAKMAENPDPKEAKSILEFHAVDIDGKDVALSKYEGFVTYIVNLASQ